MEGGASAKFPYHRPRDILTVVMSEYPWLFQGGAKGPDAERLLLSFWNAYRLEHPDHVVFGHSADRLARTVPITIHGDGGTTQKKFSLETVSLQPVLGVDTLAPTSKRSRCSCETSECYGGGGHSDVHSQQLSSKHSTYMSHFLIFGYPAKSYDFDTLLLSFLQKVCEDLASCADGFQCGDKTYYAACIGFKSDMEWLVKSAGGITRSYQNIGSVNQIPICPECEAGAPGIPFEDMAATALWTRTRFQTVPWRVAPPWGNVPYDDVKPARFLKRDSFHIFRLGIGRNYAASCIFVLAYMNCFLA